MIARISATVLFLALSTLAVASDYGEPDTEQVVEDLGVSWGPAIYLMEFSRKD